jgi:DNA-binding FadR family transcriptional regulator
VPRPALRRTVALEWLASRVGPAGDRLPPIAALAREAGVAKNTMLAAVREFCAQGALAASPGAGIRVRHRPAPTPTPPPAGAGWQRVAERLGQDILRGSFPGRFLPTMQRLSQSYGASPATLRKALGELAAAGHLRRLGRRSEIVRPDVSAPHATVLLLARGTENPASPTQQGMLSGVSLHTQENLRELERYCHQHGIRLGTVPCVYRGRHLRMGLGDGSWDALVRHRAVVGALVWTMALGEDAVADMVVKMYGAGVPIAVLDELGHLSVPPPPKGVRVGRFRLGCSVSDGELVGRYLLRLGHRRCAFIADNPQSPWSLNRYRGVAEVFRRAGRDTEVHLFAPPSRPRPSTVRSISRRARAFADDLVGGPGRPAPASRNALLSPLLSEHLRRGVDAAALHELIAPVIRTCLKRHDLTAWVAATDNVAIECTEALLSAGLRVPEDRTVVGFDDSPEAVFRGITSYNFNGPAVIRAMVDFVLGGTTHRPPHTSDYTVIEGSVVTRRTSGPPSAVD